MADYSVLSNETKHVRRANFERFENSVAAAYLFIHKHTYFLFSSLGFFSLCFIHTYIVLFLLCA